MSPVGMQRARSVTGPLRRAHPASGATWNVQVVRGKMSSKCLWHACRALSAGLMLMLLGAAMAVIGYYADTLSVDQEVRGNSTVSVKDEARGFHLNNLSYAGPIVMGFGGFIVVAACVMTFEARDSAAKVTPARPTALPRPLPRRAGACAAPARLDQLGVYRLPHVLPLPHSLPLVPLHTHRHRPTQLKIGVERVKGKARFGSAPDLRSSGTRAALPAAALRRPLRRYALSVDEPRHSAVSASAAESECGSQSSLAMDLHASGACGGVTLRVRDNTRRRPLARQQRLRDDTVHPTPVGSTYNISHTELETPKTHCEGLNKKTMEMSQLTVESEVRAHSAPPASLASPSSPVPQALASVKSPSTLAFHAPTSLASPLSPASQALTSLASPLSAASQAPTSLASPSSPTSQAPTSLASPTTPACQAPTSLASPSLPASQAPGSLASPSSLASQTSMSSASPPLHASPPPPSDPLSETCITIEHMQQETPTEEIPDDSGSSPPPDRQELPAPRDCPSGDATQHDTPPKELCKDPC